MKFLLSAEEAELLIQFEESPGLEPLASLLGRDPTVISKQLKRISLKGDFLTKTSGRWALTDAGKKFNQISKDYIFSQSNLFKGQKSLNLGGTREFTTHILGHNTQNLKMYLSLSTFSIKALEDGIENALLSGLIDIGFDCGRPYSPDIRYKQIAKEPIIPVATTTFLKNLSNIKKFVQLEEFPHILCERLHPDRVSRKEFNVKKISFRTNDISVAKNICLTGHGWALLPKYCIQKELKDKKLKPIGNFKFDQEKFGVWYLKSRVSLEPFFEKSVEWLSQNSDLLD